MNPWLIIEYNQPSFLYSYYFLLAESVQFPCSHGRSTHCHDKLHDFSVTIRTSRSTSFFLTPLDSASFVCRLFPSFNWHLIFVGSSLELKGSCDLCVLFNKFSCMLLIFAFFFLYLQALQWLLIILMMMMMMMMMI